MSALEQINKGDDGKTSDVALYLFDLQIDGERYGGHIPAISWEAAEKQVANFGGNVVGRSEEIIYDGKLCSLCSGDLRIDTTDIKPLDDYDFPEEID